SLVYACSVPVSLTLALGVALFLEAGRRPKRRTVLLSALLLPYLGSGVAIALLWRHLYHPDVGVIDRLLSHAGVTPVDWLGDPAAAIVAVTLVGVWMQFGYFVTVLVAALRRIPVAYLETARVDGAGAWQRF